MNKKMIDQVIKAIEAGQKPLEVIPEYAKLPLEERQALRLETNIRLTLEKNQLVSYK